jgi:hypothetical protein
MRAAAITLAAAAALAPLAAAQSNGKCLNYPCVSA